VVAAGLLLGACATAGATGAVGSPEAIGGSTEPAATDETIPLGVLPPDSMSLAVNNSTTLTVGLMVNGSLIASLEPNTCLGCGQDDGVPASLLPPLPWHAEVRSPSGRVLVSLTVRDGDVDYESSSDKGDASRVDLSCGQIDLWSGPPILGGPAGSGTPGDCRP
jgi:hypothetical protein